MTTFITPDPSLPIIDQLRAAREQLKDDGLNQQVILDWYLSLDRKEVARAMHELYQQDHFPNPTTTTPT